MDYLTQEALVYAKPLLGVGLLGVLTWYLCSRPRGIPPGPRGLPLLGNYHQLSLAAHMDFMELGKKYGEVFSIYMGPRLVIVLNSHRVMKEAFSTMGNAFADRPKASVFCPEQAGLFGCPFGDKFTRDKKFALNAMRGSGYGNKGMEERVISAADELVDFILKQNGQPACFIKASHKASAKIVLGILFNKDHTFDDPELLNVIDWDRKILAAFTAEANLADSLPSLAPILFRKCVNNMKRSIEGLVSSYIAKRIEEHRKTVDPDNPLDFVDYYVRSKEIVYSDKEIAAICVGFMADAIDTTGYLLIWNIMLLSMYPEWQEKLHQEIDKGLGSNKHPSLADRSILPMCEAFQQETLRFSSAFTIGLARQPLEDTTLDGYHIPKNCSVLGNFWSANRDPKLWPEPEKFKPERHLDADGNFIKTDKVWLFGLGRRACMGEPLVKNENFLLMVRVLQRFNFHLPKGAPLPNMEDVEEDVLRKPPPYKVCAIPR